MWVWIGSSAEIVALDSFRLGDRVAWSCRQSTGILIDLPPDVDHASLLVEDSDYALGTDDDFIEVDGQVVEIRAAHDQWRRASEGWLEMTPGTRVWSATEQTITTPAPPEGGASGYLASLIAR